MRRFDAIVVGGGLVGAAIGYGLTRAGLGVAHVDEGDVAFRASRGNFGPALPPNSPSRPASPSGMSATAGCSSVSARRSWRSGAR
jgi:glycine/D-amino acid oxidase-like deaminating enzyme